MEYSPNPSNILLEDNQQLRVIYAVNAALTLLEEEGLSVEKMLPRILQLTIESLTASIGSIIIFNPESLKVEYSWVVNPDFPGVHSTDKLQAVIDDGLAGWAVRQRETVIVDNCLTDPRWLIRSDFRPTQEILSAISAPIIARQQVIGTITVIKAGEAQFGQIDAFALTAITEKAAYAIENARAQEAESRYLSLFQDSVDPIILTNLQGQIIEANQRAFELFEYDREELLQMTIVDLHADDLKFPDPKQLQNHEAYFSTSRIITKTRHKPLYVEVYGKLAKYANNQIFQWIHHDITKQVELEEMRQDLTAMLVHDLQSPLGNVISSLELIKNEIPEGSDDTLVTMLDIATRSSNHLQTLVQSLMDISRLEAGHPISKQEYVDVAELVELVYEIERPNFEKREVNFIREIDPNVPQLFVEEGMIRRVLLNLLDNGLKYSVGTQAIILRIQPAPISGMALITVSDQGQGIPEKYHKTVFEKFQRINNSPTSRGLGLGLAFCRLAVEAHGGQIWVDETPGGGASFNFTVPTVPHV